MLYGLLIVVFLIVAFLLGLLILIQQSKGNMALVHWAAAHKCSLADQAAKIFFKKPLGSLDLFL